LARLFSLLSGGIDSTLVTLERIKKRDFVGCQPIFIDYG
jgi:7-cyano-7-deazaguanine synthase in queuosine biosynthesis